MRLVDRQSQHFVAHPSSHNHGSEEWFSPKVVPISKRNQPFSEASMLWERKNFKLSPIPFQYPKLFVLRKFSSDKNNTDLAAGGALQFEEGELPKQPTFQRQKPKRGDPDPNPNNHVIVTLAGLRVLLEGLWC